MNRLLYIALAFCLLLPGCKKDPNTTSTGVEIITPTGDEAYLNNGSDVIFDQNTLHTIELNLPEAALAYIDSDPTAEQYVEGSLTFNGETLSPVGIRYKGSVGAFVGGVENDEGFNFSGAKTATKLSLKIKIDWEGYNSTFYGLKRLQLHSQNLDPSQMRDRLGYWLFRSMGVPTARAVHARVVINGTYYGLYSMVEQLDEQWTNYHFENGSGNLYKEVWPMYSNGDITNERDFYRALVTNRGAGTTVDRMQEFAEAIHGADDNALRQVIQDHMDLDEILSYVAVDRLIRNDDGVFHWYCGVLGCSPHNFFWYENPATNKMHLIPWDLDNAFENILGPANEVTPIADAWGETSNDCRPFEFGALNFRQKSAACDKLTGGWASFDTEYQEIKTRFINTVFSQAEVETRIDAWADQIRPATLEASQQHSDAITIEEWEQAIETLKAQLAFARTQ